jgi:hypothetical protein
MHVFESLAKPKVDIRQKLKKLSLVEIKKLKFVDSHQVDLEVEERNLARKPKLPKDAEKGSEFISREEKIF